MTYFLSFLYGATLFYTHCYFPLAGTILSLILSGLLLFSKYRTQKAVQISTNSPLSRALLFAFPVMLIAAAGFFYAKAMHMPVQPVSDIAGETIRVRGAAESEAVPVGSRADILSQTIGITGAVDKYNRPLRIREMRIMSSTALLPGRIYDLSVSIPVDAYFLNPGSGAKIFSGYAAEMQETVAFQSGFFRASRLKLNSFIKSHFSAVSAPFLLSIITGERSLLTREMNNAFNVTGLAHILSISGAHFGLLFFVLFRIFKLVTGLLPYRVLSRITLYCTPSQIAAGLSMSFMIGYLGISDMSFPAVRSFIMIMLFLLGLLIQRKGFWLNTLALAAVIIVLMNPDSLLDLSFQLSFIAVLCLGLVTEISAEGREHGSGEAPECEKRNVHKVASLLQRFRNYALSSIRSSLLISLAATAGTAPLVIYYFHYFSLVSPFTNLVITPFIGFIILPPALMASFIYLVSGCFPLVSLIDRLTGSALATIRYIARWDYADIRVPAFPAAVLIMFYFGLFLYVALMLRNGPVITGNGSKDGKPGKPPFVARYALLTVLIACTPLLLFAGVGFARPKGVRITYLDVGQGDAAVVELPDDRTVVMDTGKSGFQVSEFLRYRGIRKIDALVLSHGDFDHAGGAYHLLDTFRTDEIWDNNRLLYMRGLPEGVLHRGLQRGDEVRGDGYLITVLHPYKGFYSSNFRDSDENNGSLVIRIQGVKNTFLFTGDMQREGAEDVTHLGKYLRSTVVKVPHHGGRSSASPEFYEAVSPEIAVISVGRKNRYGHPHAGVLALLRNTRVFRTDREGAVGVREKPDGSLEVKAWNEFQLAEAKGIGDEWANVKRLFMVW